jgi:predicted hydrolase (HD superfamily)
LGALQAVQEELDDGVMRAKIRRSQMVVSDDIKRRHEKDNALLSQKEHLPEEELAAARCSLIQHMLPRETVMQALTRLSGKRSQHPVRATVYHQHKEWRWPFSSISLPTKCSRLSKWQQS